MTPPPPLLMTMREVSALTGIPVETLRYWRKRKRGEGPPCVAVGGRVRYKRAAVTAWVDALSPDGARRVDDCDECRGTVTPGRYCAGCGRFGESPSTAIGA